MARFGEAVAAVLVAVLVSACGAASHGNASPGSPPPNRPYVESKACRAAAGLAVRMLDVTVARAQAKGGASAADFDAPVRRAEHQRDAIDTECSNRTNLAYAQLMYELTFVKSSLTMCENSLRCHVTQMMRLASSHFQAAKRHGNRLRTLVTTRR